LFGKDLISGSSTHDLDNREVGGPDHVLVGTDMKRGMALSVLETIRTLPEDEQQNLLKLRADGDLDLVLDSLFRPELKCPREFAGVPASVRDIKENRI
jgi:hypothetical protein